MCRTITLSMAVFMTLVAFVFSNPDAKAQHGPGYTACSGKWVEAGRPNGWNEFMDSCVKSFRPALQDTTQTQVKPDVSQRSQIVGRMGPTMDFRPEIEASHTSMLPKKQEWRPVFVPGLISYDDLVKVYGKDSVNAAIMGHPDSSKEMMAQLNAEREKRLGYEAQQENTKIIFGNPAAR
jgi:hypothetical protein